MQFTVAVDISYIDKEIQRWLYEYITILNESQPGRTPSSKNIISEKKLREYFPDNYTAADMRSVILELLEQWKTGRNKQ
jgi:ParB family chromosome partitioning protein